MKENFLFSVRCDMLSKEPVDKLSIAMTLKDFFINFADNGLRNI